MSRTILHAVCRLLGLAGLLKKRPGGSYVLMFHSVEPDIFSKQIEYIQKNFEIITLNKLMKQKRFESKIVALTFDDGLVNTYEIAYPILKKLGVKASAYIISGRVGKKDYMTWKQIREIKTAFTIGAHTVTHPELHMLWDSEAAGEILESKKQIEKEVGPCDQFCYPRGSFTESTKHLVSMAGLDLAVSDYVNTVDESTEHLAIPRIGINKEDTEAIINAKMSPVSFALQRVIMSVRKAIPA